MEELVNISQLPKVLQSFYKNAEELQGKIACGKIHDDHIDSLTYYELRIRARDFAGYLQTISFKGDRAILLAETYNDFLIAFYGCMLAGVIAVPCHVGNPKKMAKLEYIIADCDAKLVIGVEKTISKFKPYLSKDISVISVEKSLAKCKYSEPEFNDNDIVFLQYTSGTTSDPKGVMITFSNLFMNLKMIKKSFGFDEQLIMVSWLPFYHDMGLIGMLLSPIFSGATTYYLTPIQFVKKPILYLQALTNLNATCTGAPNFAFDHCVQRIKKENCEGLNFSKLKTFFCGAEPIRLNSLQDFSEKFAAYNFNYNALFPCYGMAEVVLFATGVSIKEPIFWQAFDSEDITRNIVTPLNPEALGASKLVGCGFPTENSDAEVIIVNPDTCKKVENKIGEIWITGSHVSRGYWKKETLSEKIFRAKLVGGDNRGYLRTGDLGFIFNGQLFISGRIKNLIIIGGRNIYPHDIETSVNESNELMKNGRCTAFSVLEDGHEQLICIKEVSRNLYLSLVKYEQFKDVETKKVIDEIHRSIQHNISENNGVIAHDVFLILQGRLSTTTSGKIQVQGTKKGYMLNTLEGFSLMDFVKLS